MKNIMDVEIWKILWSVKKKKDNKTIPLDLHA